MQKYDYYLFKYRKGLVLRLNLVGRLLLLVKFSITHFYALLSVRKVILETSTGIMINSNTKYPLQEEGMINCLIAFRKIKRGSSTVFLIVYS